MGSPKRLCTICARGGSKGVKNKNIRLLAGIPLIGHTLRQALQSGLFLEIAVSSDSPEILEAAEHHGATMLIERPPELASDTAAKVPAIQHAVRTAEARTGITFDTLVDLDATAPLRLPEDISGAVALLEDKGVANVITGCPARRSPYFNLVERREDGSVGLSKTLAKPIVRRQDAPSCFDMNASIYVWRRDALFAGSSVFFPDTLLYEMPETRSVDIDNEVDFVIVEALFARL